MPVDPRLDLELPAADRIHGERPGEAIVPEKAQRLLAPARPSPTVPHDGAERVVAVADDRRGDRDAVADAGLGRPAAAVHLRRDLGDHDPGAGHPRHTVNSPPCDWSGHSACSCIRRRCPGAASGRRRTRSWTGSTRPAPGGGRCSRSPRPTHSDRPIPRHPRSPAGAASSPTRRRRSAPPRRSRSARGRPPGSTTGRSSRAKAPSRSRCASRANGARFAPMPPIGECGSSETCRSTSRPGGCDHARASRAVPAARAGRRRRAAGRPQRARPALGKSALRLGRARADGIPLVDRPDAPRAGPRRPLPARPLPRLRRVLGGARRAPESARGGAWRPGPGRAVFDAARAELGDLPVVAEDLGVITPDVRELRDALGFPGMAVTIWAFSGGRDNPHRLENHRPRQVVYTSTHDTETLAGAFGERDAWQLVELTLASVGELAIVPVQDVLGLGNEARMNRPGTTGGNWSWRLEAGQLTAVRTRRGCARPPSRAVARPPRRGSAGRGRAGSPARAARPRGGGRRRGRARSRSRPLRRSRRPGGTRSART